MNNILNIYEEWTQRKDDIDKKESLSATIRNGMSMSYIDVLNYYHMILNQNSRHHNIQCNKCSGRNISMSYF